MDENGWELILLTAAENRRLFNLRTRVTPSRVAYHDYWSDRRSSRQARRGHSRRRTESIKVGLQ